LTYKKVLNSPFGALYVFIDNKNKEFYLTGDNLKISLDNRTIKKVEIISDTQSGIKPTEQKQIIPEQVQSDIKDKIADIEIAALGEKETPSEFSTEKETSLVMMNELELFNYLKEKEEPEINKYESYNDLLNNQTRETQNNIKRAKGIKNYLLKLAERDSSDSLNDLTIEKILKNNPNIKKSC
jgi:hypothetical protein